jgi:hypothetical protein
MRHDVDPSLGYAQVLGDLGPRCLGVSDHPIGSSGRWKDEGTPEQARVEGNRAGLPQPRDVGDRDDARRTHPEWGDQGDAVQHLAASPVGKRAEQERLAESACSTPAEERVFDELNVAGPRLRGEQPAALLVDENRDPKVRPDLQERRIETTQVRLDPAHPRLEEDGVDAEMAQRGRHRRAMVRIRSSAVAADDERDNVRE